MEDELTMPLPPVLMHTLNTDGRLGMYVNPTICKCETCVTYCAENGLEPYNEEVVYVEEQDNEDTQSYYSQEEEEEREDYSCLNCGESCRKGERFCSEMCYGRRRRCGIHDSDDE